MTVVLAPTAAESFAAIGTTVTVVVTDRSALARAAALLRGELDDLDRACSRFRDDSELRRVERAGEARVEETLAVHVNAALRAADVTGGLLDPTVGACMNALGYDRDLAEISDSDHAVEPVPAPGWRAIGWQPHTRTLRIPDGVRLDLGSTAKALAADRAADRIAGHLGCGVLVDLGGDVAVAGPAPDAGWRIRVGDGARSPGPVVMIRSGGLATSGIGRRRWRRGPTWCHHVVDPSTGRPADGPWRTVTVAAGTCLDANTAATAALLLGEDAPTHLARSALPARLTSGSGPAVTVAGWPTERDGP